MEIKAVEIVEITKKTPIFKSGEMANAIESISFKYNDGSNCGYNLISQKDLYEVGDLAIYIQPDYCLPEDIDLFDGFIKPNGDPKKSRLGKHGRIRAVKFNFNFENSTEPIYSFGILLPMDKVTPYITNPDNLQESLKITKYEEPEQQGSGLVAGAFPGFMYKTDEVNCIEENQLVYTDKGFVKVKDVCKDITKYKVLSFNHETEKEEFKEIEDFSVKENNNDWYEITLEDDSTMILSSIHPVFLPILNCYRKVEELTEEDFLYKTD